MGVCVFFQIANMHRINEKRKIGRKSHLTICTLNQDEGRSVRFRKEESETTKTSFKKAELKTGMLSPNERLLEQVKKSMERLGVTEKIDPAPARKLKDYSHVQPLSAFSGAFGAALISAAIWSLLQVLVKMYALHPIESDFYVVNRITAVVRTAVVGLLALGSGMSGVTGMGLFLLGFRVSADTLTKRKSDGEYTDGAGNE